MYIHGEKLIDDICVVMTSNCDDIPENYKDVMVVGTAQPGAVDPGYFFMYHDCSPLGLCDLGFEASTVDRYPAKVRIYLFFSDLTYDLITAYFSIVPCESSHNNNFFYYFRYLNIYLLFKYHF